MIVVRAGLVLGAARIDRSALTDLMDSMRPLWRPFGPRRVGAPLHRPLARPPTGSVQDVELNRYAPLLSTGQKPEFVSQRARAGHGCLAGCGGASRSRAAL